MTNLILIVTITLMTNSVYSPEHDKSVQIINKKYIGTIIYDEKTNKFIIKEEQWALPELKSNTNKWRYSEYLLFTHPTEK